MKKITVKAITQNDEVLELKAMTTEKFGVFAILTDNYALSNLCLYKQKGNVICAEKVETKQLIIQIDE